MSHPTLSVSHIDPVATLRAQLQKGGDEALLFENYQQAMAMMPEEVWLDGVGGLFQDAVYYGHLAIYENLCDRLEPDPTRHAALFMRTATMSKSPDMMRAVLVHSQGVELEDFEIGLRNILCGRAGADRVAEMVEVFFSDSRTHTAEALYHAWNMVGSQGEAAAVPKLHAAHQVMTQTMLREESDLLIATAWDQALLNLCCKIHPDQDMAGTVQATWALLDTKTILSYLNWDGNRLHSMPQYFAIYDHALTVENETLRVASDKHGWPIEQWRDLMFQVGGAELMPREGARRRLSRTTSVPNVKDTTSPARSRIRP